MASQASLARLLRPRRIALIGLADVCDRVAATLAGLGSDAEVHGVNPRRQVSGVPTVQTVADLPWVPDAAFVAVPADRVVPVVAELAGMGCGGAVVYSSGFAETATASDGTGANRQAELVRAAGSMPILGPNCYGLLNYADSIGLWPDEHGGRPIPDGGRGVAIVAQSSSIAISMTMGRHGLPVAYCLTVGNAATRNAFRVGVELLDDPRVSAVGLLIESVSDVRGIEHLARTARQRGVPVVALVLGRSPEAARVALSHSASLHTDQALVAELLRRNGIGQVDDVEELLATLNLLHCHGPLPGTTLTSLSCSGGEASLMADAAAGSSLTFPELTDAVRERLRAVLGERVTLDNPLDYHTYVWGDRAAMTAAFAAMLTGPADLNVFFADIPRADRCDQAGWLPSVAAFVDACRASGARGAVTAAMSVNLTEPITTELVAAGVAVLAPPRVAVRAVEVAAAIGRATEQPLRDPLWPPFPAGPVRVLDEVASKTLLTSPAVRPPRGRQCRSAAEAASTAAEFGGPVAVKALGLAHKSDVGGVRLGLIGPDQVADAARDLLELGPALLIEEMIAEPVAELIVSIDSHPGLGRVLTVGFGGVEVELERDVRQLLVPCSAADLAQALRALRGFGRLDGFRGRPRVDLRVVLAAIDSLVQTASRPGVVSIEVNPLMVTATGVVMADALVSVAAGATASDPFADSSAQLSASEKEDTDVAAH